MVTEMRRIADGVEALMAGQQEIIVGIDRVVEEQRSVHRFFITRQAAAERLVRQAFEFADGVFQVGAQSVFVMPLDLFAGAFVFKADQQARAQDSLGLEHVLEAADGEFG